MLIPPVETPNTPAFKSVPPPRMRRDGKNVPVQEASTVTRMPAVSRRLQGDSSDPTLNPTYSRRQPGEPALEQDRTRRRSSEDPRTSEEKYAAKAIQRAFAEVSDRDIHAERTGQKESEQQSGQGADKSKASPALRQPNRELSAEDKRKVDRLRARDREVRAHERSHQAAAGGLAGPARFETVVGPDGRSYAVEGEVPINVSAGGTAQQTLERAQQVQRAALAPMHPSGQDMSVAAQASRMAAQARLEIARQEAEARSEQGSDDTQGGFGLSLAERSRDITTTRRSGGVAGGHMHTSLKCQFCSNGIVAYQNGLL